MAATQKTTVRADIKKNRLLIILSPVVNKKELDKVYTEVRFCVADLQPGFDVITDLSQCNLGHLNGLPTLRKIMAFLVAHKVGRVVRIVGEMSVVLKQLLGFSSRFHSYRPAYVSSLQEAEQQLEQPDKRSALRFRINERTVEFTRDGESGSGTLVDISTSGCAVAGVTLQVIKDQEVTLTVPLHDPTDAEISFALTGRVVTARDDQFAVQFTDMDQSQRDQLYQCLGHEMKRDAL